VIETVVIPLLKIVILLAALLAAVAYLVLLERKVVAWVQVRLGPMRVGPHGVLQPIADVLKLFLKEDLTPARADRWVFTLAPIIALVPALIVFAVIPFGPATRIFGYEVPVYIADINVGLLYIVSVASIGVYGLILGGYASNSKYPLLASLRASAQLISYEVAVTMTLVSLILTAGSLSLVEIVEAQRRAGVWYAFVQPVALLIYFVGGLAETNRAPFDLPEAEQELVGGFHTEYSGMRFAYFFLAEYANMIVISAVATTLFFGGWLRPFPNVGWLWVLDLVPAWVWFLLKTLGLLYLFLWIRATLPRYRYDQLMRLGWKVLIPLAIANLIVTGAAKVWL
jgi:NADH-quinone oxidoreductase subunit H